MLSTGHQLRAARSLIGWEQTDVASASGLSVNTIRSMEASGAAAIAGRAANVQKVQKALEEGGIEFLNHGSPGVRLVKRFSQEEIDRENAALEATYIDTPD